MPSLKKPLLAHPARLAALLAAVAALLALLTGIAAALDLPVEEADINPSGEVYEVNRAADGRLYVADYGAGELRVISADAMAYTAYIVPFVQDARPDPQGRIWWTDGAESFGYVDPSSNTRTQWAAGTPGDVNLWGTALDSAGRVWMSEWFGSTSKLFRFDPVTSELCSYELPGRSWSTYLLYDGASLWLGNWFNHRIIRFDPASSLAQWWTLPTGNTPYGLGLDGNGHLWWGDPGGNTLSRLEPASNRLTEYALPAGNEPQLVAPVGSQIWYSDLSGTVGVLDPAVAGGTSSTRSTNTQAVLSSCSPLGAGATSPSPPVTGSLTWSAGTWATLVQAGGWTIYQLPGGASPYGITATGGHLWVGDQGRQKLARTPLAQPSCHPTDVHPNADHQGNPAACDGDVDIADVQRVSGCFNQAVGPSCPATLDFNNTGIIDVGDLVIVGDDWGWPN